MSVKEIMGVIMSVTTHWEVMSVLAGMDLGLVMTEKLVKVCVYIQTLMV